VTCALHAPSATRAPRTMSRAFGSTALTVADPARGAHPLDGRGWDLYLLAVPWLVPLATPVAAGQIACLDLLNAVALLAFTLTVVSRRVAVELPLLVPLFLAGTGSVLAVADARSVGAAVLALAQDLYLYLWLVMLLALLRRRGDLARFRIAWVAAAGAVALTCLAQWLERSGLSLVSLVQPGGLRSAGSFANPNLCANYLALGVFVLLGLEGRVRPWLLWVGGALLGAALLATKSNGGLFALAVGLMVSSGVRARSRGTDVRRLAGVTALGLAALVLAAWGARETTTGAAWLQAMGERTLIGRVAHSSESRERIWQRLEHSLARSPLGIGPANSSAQALEIGEHERRDSAQAKEAHSDYLAYLVERGPLGLLGLLAGIGQIGALVARGRRRLDARAGPRCGGALQAAFAGALATLLVQSTVLEQLHFRHLWAFLALMCAAAGPVVVERRARVRLGRAPRAGLELGDQPA